MSIYKALNRGGFGFSVGSKTKIDNIVAQYPYVLLAEEGQLEFTIPLETFNKDTDIVLVALNRTLLDPNDFSIEGRNLILNIEPEEVTKDSTLYIHVLKNVLVGIDSSAPLADYSVTKSKLEPTIQEILDKIVPLEEEFITHEAENATDAHKISNITGLQTELDSKAGNKNLLHNWDFRNPVNQRGQSSYTSSSGKLYTIDRWYISNTGMSMSLASGGGYITLNSATTLWQLIEVPELGKPYTASIELLDGTYIELKVENLNKSTDASVYWTGGRLRLQYYNGYFAFGIYSLAGYTQNIVSAKLELGPASTLANDPPADYGEQLALCQRYQLKLGAIARYRACQITSNIIDFFIPTPTTIRVNPTIDADAISVMNLNGTAQTGFTFTTHNAANSLNGFVIRCTKTGHGMTDAILSITTGTIIDVNL